MNTTEIAAKLLAPSPHLAELENTEDMPASGRISTTKVARQVTKERERLRLLALELIRLTNP